jgi:hypothetical protein
MDLQGLWTREVMVAVVKTLIGLVIAVGSFAVFIGIPLLVFYFIYWLLS